MDVWDERAWIWWGRSLIDIGVVSVNVVLCQVLLNNESVSNGEDFPTQVSIYNDEVVIDLICKIICFCIIDLSSETDFKKYV